MDFRGARGLGAGLQIEPNEAKERKGEESQVSRARER